MIDETNENVTDNTRGNENPYMAQSVTGEENVANTEKGAFSPIPEESVKKPANKVVIGVVIGIVVLIILALVLILSGIFYNKKVTVLKALEKTFTESGDYLEEVYSANQYEGMFETEDYTIDAEFDTNYYGLGIDISARKKQTANSVQISADMMGEKIGADVYADDNEIVIALPEMLDYLLTVNRATLADDIQNLVELGMLDEETAEKLVTLNDDADQTSVDKEAYEKFEKELLTAVKDFYDSCDMKKGESKELTVDGTEVKCKGYVLVITGEDAISFLENVKEVCRNNEECLEAANALYSPSDMGAYTNLDNLYEGLDEAISELENRENEVLEVEFYLYKNKVAQIYLEGDEEEFIEWNIEGGNFPLENTNFTCEDEYGDKFFIGRTGTDEDSKYQVKYEFIDEYDESAVLEFKYKKEKGDFSMEVFGNDESMLYMEGSISKEDENTVELDIDGIETEGESLCSGKVTIAGVCDEVVRPEGDEKQLLLLTDDEWNQLAMDILESFY